MDEGDRNKLKAMLAARRFDPYIEHIRFPHYKNLSPDLRIAALATDNLRDAGSPQA